MEIILASNSPRRKEILEKFGYKFTVIKSGYEEKGVFSDPVFSSLTFAKNKALDVYGSLSAAERARSLVIGADTVVYYGGKILGKPKDVKDAFETLTALSGNTHHVYTGYALISEKSRVFGVDVSTVTFNALTEENIREYVATGKPLDKAGSYGIQDGFGLVKSVQGSEYNVIGFPIEKIAPVIAAVEKCAFSL